MASQTARAAADVWMISLDEVELDASGGRGVLSQTELERCERFRTPLLRRRHRASCTALRRILASRLGRPPALLSFERDLFGKPRLRCDPRVHFNLSHSGPEATVAVASTPLGVDIEAVDHLLATPGVAASAFALPELAAWQRLPARFRVAAFFKAWTSREAVVKAGGEGLGSVARFEVCVDPRRPSGIVVGAGRWRLHDLPTAPGFRAVLCADVAVETVHVRRWRDGCESDGVTR